jgi:hypothetical protein
VIRRSLLIALLVLGAALVLPVLAGAQETSSDGTDVTEPDTTIQHVKVTKKGVARVWFTGTDDVDAVSDLEYDCYLDGGDHAGGSDDSDDEDEDSDDADDGDDSDDEEVDDPEEEEESAARSGDVELDCGSPWVIKGLGPGKHTVEVSAYDVEWNEDSTPAKAQFKVRKPK